MGVLAVGSCCPLKLFAWGLTPEGSHFSAQGAGWGVCPHTRCRRPSVSLWRGDVATARCDPHGRQGALWPRGCPPAARGAAAAAAPLRTVAQRSAASLALCTGHPPQNPCPLGRHRGSRGSLAPVGPAGGLPPFWRPQFVICGVALPALLEATPPLQAFWFLVCVLRVTGPWKPDVPAICRVSYFSFLPAVGRLASLPPFLEEYGFDLEFLLFRGDAPLCPGASVLLPPDPPPGHPHRHL